ncbi:Enoyl-CoA hydratase/carnithine racemase [Pseudooceanicola antarcticus]|uniref:Enoyl-CoA hydratase/carnithine racemase n=1 Tax=Pseudooceanicola antarcticus TaxID=1247613 RepID=A0A285HPH7_9RHOB|nr:enoyl-CoA hydratase/isomerase family protein [Pseudooceanicola antarcticus]PJE27720.1 enoyl-CoA hydratase/isomerase family protein [Pseudooceanicola antarcticus]SNY37493.1 Enoyl-CoA hydratase/carnithine racemase [Pseudooceanicola antarcticus]
MIRSEILDSGLHLVTLARPEKANALSAAMLQELTGVIAASTARALVLTGEGRVFSAGADLDEAHRGLGVSPLWEELSGAVAAHPGLTIAALNGTLAGGAMGMALACDLRLAVPEARFFYPVMKLGFLPQPSDPRRMGQLIGPSRTKMLLMGGQKIGAEEALAWGLVDRVVAQPLVEAQALAADVLAAAPEHVTAIKRMCGPET